MLKVFDVCGSAVACVSRRFSVCASIWLVVLLVSHSSPAQSMLDDFADAEDGRFDVGSWLEKPFGFMPVGTIITEPAIGVGIAGGIVFFHPPEGMDEPNEFDPAKLAAVPPSMSGVLGLITDNESWLAGGFHVGHWRQDSIRYTGAFIYPSLNLNFYGGGDTPDFVRGLSYNLEGWLLLQELLFRIDQSNVFLGGRLSVSDIRSKFKIPALPPGIDRWEIDYDAVGAGFVLVYDSVDNTFTPNSGVEAEISTMVYNTEGLLGFREEHQITSLQGSRFWQMRDDLVLGWHLAGEFGSGDIPFFALPDITLRGIPAMRYQDTHAVMTEVELRWDLDSRWSLVGFGGVGGVAEALDEFDNSQARWAGGGGFRYLLAKGLGIRAGLDVAAGPEEVVVYVQVGQAWSF